MRDRNGSTGVPLSVSGQYSRGLVKRKSVYRIAIRAMVETTAMEMIYLVAELIWAA
jgi:hypothetical protein